MAVRFGWQVSITTSLLLFSLSTLYLQTVSIPLHVIVPVVIAAIFAGLNLMPKGDVEEGESKAGRWDIPARILIGTSFILLLTGVAPLIGSRMTGLLTTIPLYITILTIFAHRDRGPAAAAHALRGLLYGMFAFTGFFLILGLLIERTSMGTSLFILRKLHG
jgi:hypothetical protein